MEPQNILGGSKPHQETKGGEQEETGGRTDDRTQLRRQRQCHNVKNRAGTEVKQ